MVDVSRMAPVVSSGVVNRRQPEEDRRHKRRRQDPDADPFALDDAVEVALGREPASAALDEDAVEVTVGGAYQQAPFSERESAFDPAALLEIPPAEMTPKVRAAIDGLIQEVERLRGALERTTRDGRRAKRTAERHSRLPVLSRRGFDRRLEAVVRKAEEAGTDVTLILVHLGSAEDMWRCYGPERVHDAVRVLAEILDNHAGLTDFVGLVGGVDLALALPFTGQAAAEERLERLRPALDGAHLFIQGGRVPLRAWTGLASRKAGEGADALVVRAARAAVPDL